MDKIVILRTQSLCNNSNNSVYLQQPIQLSLLAHTTQSSCSNSYNSIYLQQLIQLGGDIPKSPRQLAIGQIDLISFKKGTMSPTSRYQGLIIIDYYEQNKSYLKSEASQTSRLRLPKPPTWATWQSGKLTSSHFRKGPSARFQAPQGCGSKRQNKVGDLHTYMHLFLKILYQGIRFKIIIKSANIKFRPKLCTQQKCTYNLLQTLKIVFFGGSCKKTENKNQRPAKLTKNLQNRKKITEFKNNIEFKNSTE